MNSLQRNTRPRWPRNVESISARWYDLAAAINGVWPANILPREHQTNNISCRGISIEILQYMQDCRELQHILSCTFSSPPHANKNLNLANLARLSLDCLPFQFLFLAALCSPPAFSRVPVLSGFAIPCIHLGYLKSPLLPRPWTNFQSLGHLGRSYVETPSGWIVIRWVDPEMAKARPSK